MKFMADREKSAEQMAAAQEVTINVAAGMGECHLRR